MGSTFTDILQMSPSDTGEQHNTIGSITFRMTFVQLIVVCSVLFENKFQNISYQGTEKLVFHYDSLSYHWGFLIFIMNLPYFDRCATFAEHNHPFPQSVASLLLIYHYSMACSDKWHSLVPPSLPFKLWPTMLHTQLWIIPLPYVFH